MSTLLLHVDHYFLGQEFLKTIKAYQTRGGIAAWDCSAASVISTDTIDRATTNMDFSADILARAMFFVQNETFYVAPPPTTTTERATLATSLATSGSTLATSAFTKSSTRASTTTTTTTETNAGSTTTWTSESTTETSSIWTTT